MSLPNKLRNCLTGCLVMAFVAGCTVANQIKSDMAVNEAEAAYVAKDYVAATEAYRRSAESGGGYGQYMLSWMYAEGKGVKQDRAEAARWMQKAADSGYPAANFTLGIRALGGVGEKRDPKAAADHFRKAAEGEDDIAMFYLGMLHLRGLGVAADSTEALRWFRMAKAHGYPVHPGLLTEQGIAMQMKTQPRISAKQGKNAHDAKLLVSDIQTQLQRLGYSVGTPDGLAGSKTRAAIEAFQKARGLTVNGKPDKDLLKALQSAK